VQAHLTSAIAKAIALDMTNAPAAASNDPRRTRPYFELDRAANELTAVTQATLYPSHRVPLWLLVGAPPARRLPP